MNAIAIRVTSKGMLEFDMRHKPKDVSSTMALFGYLIQHPEKFTRTPSAEIGAIAIRVTQDGEIVSGEARANNLTDHELAGIGWWAILEYHHLLLLSAAKQQRAAQQAQNRQLDLVKELMQGRGVRKANG